MYMTNSLNNQRIKKILEDFLEGQLSLSQVQVMLRDHIIIDFDLASTRREISENNLDDEVIQISVTKNHVCHILQQYISGNISASELSNWASLIFMLPVFTPGGETEDERWNAGDEPMWDVIQRLATPDIFGGLNPEIAYHYLGLLNQ